MAVTYQLGPETEMLDAAFYAGQAEDGSDVAGRMGFFGRPSSDGTTVAFWAVNAATSGTSIFLVDVGDTSSWRRLTDDLWTAPTEYINWSPDNLYIVARRNRISVATGAVTTPVLFGDSVFEISMTSRPTGNWGVTMVTTNTSAPGDGGDDAMAVPILADGREDPSREPIFLTAMGQLGQDFDWPVVFTSMNSLIMLHQDIPWTNPWTAGNVILIRDVLEILNAPKVPGTDISSKAIGSLSDPGVVAIENGLDLAAPSGYSADGSLVFFCEDFNRQFTTENFFASLFVSDFDIMIANADGSGTPTRLAVPGNQLMAIPTPGGIRLIYCRDVGGVVRLFVTTLEVATEVSGTVEGDPSNNDIQTTEEQQASDASGTTLVVPVDTVINFPGGEPQEIQITTPIDPATEPQLPPNIDAIPVIREFGPDGTTFSPAITVTITYTDAQVAGLDEANLRVFYYSSVSGKYDDEVTTITSRDLVNNTISFTVDHFSLLGVGGAVDTDLDGTPDDTDTDDDNDGVLDVDDLYPLDTDDDGLDNLIDSDDDADGMPDGDDVYPLDTDNDALRNDVDEDDDGDGLSDVDEIEIYGTEHLNADTDGDGLSDGVEIRFCMDPLTPDAGAGMPLRPLLPFALVLLLAAVWQLKRRRPASRRT